MLLTYDDQQFLISKNLIGSDWIISDILGSEIKDFLITHCGFNESIGEIPATLLKSNLIKLGMSGTDYDVDPWVQLKGFVTDFFINDKVIIPTSPTNASSENELRIRRSSGSKFIACQETGGIFIQYDNFMRKIATPGGGYIYTMWSSSDGSEIYIGGDFAEINGITCSKVAKITLADPRVPWSNYTISQPGDGFDGIVHCIKEIAGEIYAVGNFNASGEISISKVAKWDTGGSTWIEVSPDPINDPVRVIAAAPISGDIYIGTGEIFSVTPDSRIFILDTGSWIPLVFPEITADPNGWLSNGVIFDIVFNADETKMILGGQFTSYCTGNDRDLLIVNLIDNTTLHHGFAATHPDGGAGWIKSILLHSASADILSVVGVFGQFTATNIDIYNCRGLVILNGFVMDVTKSMERPLTTTLLQYEVYGQGILNDGDLNIFYVGSFDAVADSFNTFIGTLPGAYSSSRYMKFHTNGFSMNLGDHINESQSISNIENNFSFSLIKPIAEFIPPP